MSSNEDRVVAGLINEKDISKIREAVCVQVEKVYDSCKEKDCIEDATVLFKYPERVQPLINKAINVKSRKAEVIYVYADVEAVPFKRGFYTVDVKYFIKVTLDFFVPKMNAGIKIITVPGFIVFDKKVILFGSEGGVKIFKSHFVENGIDTPETSTLQQDNLPISKIEVAEPISLNAKIEDVVEKIFDDSCCDRLPRSVAESLGEESEYDFDVGDEMVGEEDERHCVITKKVVATVGLFSIIKLVRFVQLLIPSFHFCYPNKKCIASTNEDPCELFETIEFPFDEFFPAQKFDFPGALENERAMLEEIESEE